MDVLRRNGGKLPLLELQQDWQVKRSEVADLLVLPVDQCPIRIEYHLNGNPSGKATTFVALKKFTTPEPATQAQAAKFLDQMTPDQYRKFLIDIDPSLKSRLARRGYRKRGITPEEYLA